MEEKTMRKRFLSLLLVLVCVLTLAAAPVAAAEPDAVQSPTSTTEPAVPTTEPTAPVEPSTEPSPEPSPEPTPTGPWYQAAMDFACAHGILLGDEHGDLLPMAMPRAHRWLPCSCACSAARQGRTLRSFPM